MANSGRSSAEFTFRLVHTGTDKLIDIQKDQKVQFSLYDFDAGKSPNLIDPHEFAEFKTLVASYGAVEDTSVRIEGNGPDGTLSVRSGRSGSAADNPTDPLKMTTLQQQSKVSVTYVGTAEWKIVLGDVRDLPRAGRNFLYAGRSQGDCACIGVADWTLHNNLKYNNLGGLGPVTSDPAELRYTRKSSLLDTRGSLLIWLSRSPMVRLISWQIQISMVCGQSIQTPHKCAKSTSKLGRNPRSISCSLRQALMNYTS